MYAFKDNVLSSYVRTHMEDKTKQFFFLGEIQEILKKF